MNKYQIALMRAMKEYNIYNENNHNLKNMIIHNLYSLYQAIKAPTIITNNLNIDTIDDAIKYNEFKLYYNELIINYIIEDIKITLEKLMLQSNFVFNNILKKRINVIEFQNKLYEYIIQFIKHNGIQTLTYYDYSWKSMNPIRKFVMEKYNMTPDVADGMMTSYERILAQTNINKK